MGYRVGGRSCSGVHVLIDVLFMALNLAVPIILGGFLIESQFDATIRHHDVTGPEIGSLWPDSRCP